MFETIESGIAITTAGRTDTDCAELFHVHECYFSFKSTHAEIR